MTKRLFILAAVLFTSLPVIAASVNPPSFQVKIQDEKGVPIQNATLFILSRTTNQFLESRKVSGSTAFNLPLGDYQVSAGYSVENKGIIDHYATPEASVHVNPLEPTSVILTMKKSEPKEFILSDNSREKMGLDPELAKYLN